MAKSKEIAMVEVGISDQTLFNLMLQREWTKVMTKWM